MRINKFLATCGLSSRRHAEDFILSGKVKVNGKVVKDLAIDITDLDVVEVQGKKMALPDEKVYYMLNKPTGVLTTLDDGRFHRPTVMDFLPKSNLHVFPVGRLDFNTSGLLLLTNDGDFANKITHPSKKISKIYEVRLTKELSVWDIKTLEGGVEIDGLMTTPCEIKSIKNIGIEKASILITIHEGRNRQIRKMVETVNNKVLSLRRLQIGKLKLGTLPVGKWKKLSQDEIKSIFI